MKQCHHHVVFSSVQKNTSPPLFIKAFIATPAFCLSLINQPDYTKRQGLLVSRHSIRCSLHKYVCTLDLQPNYPFMREKAVPQSASAGSDAANCSGSSEAGSTEQMCSLTSFSKHLLKMGVRATGLQTFKHVILFFFGMGTIVDFLKHEGTMDRERDRLKMSVKTPASWKAHALTHGLVYHLGPRLCRCSPV